LCESRFATCAWKKCSTRLQICCSCLFDVAHGFGLLREVDCGVWEHWICVVRVELEISSGGVLCGLDDARINFPCSNFIHRHWLILM